MVTSKQSKIFISYAREDELMAGRIFGELSRRGADVWMDKESLLGGDDFEIVIASAIESCQFFLVILSKSSVNKTGYVNKEIRKALDVLDRHPEGRRFIVPVRLDDCSPSYEKLRKLNYIDLFPDFDRGFDLLLRSLGWKKDPIRYFPDSDKIAQLIQELGDVRTHYVTPLGDVVAFRESFDSTMGWSHGRQSIELFEWDSINSRYRDDNHVYLDGGTSRAQYYIGGGTDEYHDEKISNLRMDYGSSILVWEKVICDSEENEWTSHHEVSHEETQIRAYNTVRKQFVRDLLCPRCGTVIESRLQESQKMP